MSKFLSVMMAATAAVALTTTVVKADDYPSKPVKIVVPYAPGGTTDNTVRVIAEGLKDQLGTVVISNVSGGGGVVGMAQALQGAPDGYTVGMYLSNTLVGMATGVAPFGADAIEPACMYGDAPLTFTINGGTDAKTIADVVDKGSTTAAIERGTLSQFAGLMLNEQLGGKLELVNVGVGAEKRAAVLGGHVTALVDPVPAVVGDYKAGELSILAVLTDERLPGLPEVATAKEQGIDVALSQSNGFMFPAGTPKPVVDTFCSALKAVTESEDFKSKMKAMNLEVVYRDGEDYARYMDKLLDRITKLAKDQGYAQ